MEAETGRNELILVASCFYVAEVPEANCRAAIMAPASVTITANISGINARQSGNRGITLETTQLKVTGMMCQACVSHVVRALQAVNGVRQATVDLSGGNATVRHEGADLGALLRAVDEAGYEAQVDA